MKFGVLGAAHGHVNDFCAEMCAAGHTLAAIWADGTDNAKALSERYGAPLLETPEDVIACGIEAAGTFAPSFQRIQMILLCEKHGVHVMSDKPLAVDWKALKDLEGVVARGQIQVSAMFTVRFMPPVRKLYELIHQGELGELVSIEILNPHKLHRLFFLNKAFCFSLDIRCIFIYKNLVIRSLFITCHKRQFGTRRHQNIKLF